MQMIQKNNQNRKIFQQNLYVHLIQSGYCALITWQPFIVKKRFKIKGMWGGGRFFAYFFILGWVSLYSWELYFPAVKLLFLPVRKFVYKLNTKWLLCIDNPATPYKND